MTDMDPDRSGSFAGLSRRGFMVGAGVVGAAGIASGGARILREAPASIRALSGRSAPASSPAPSSGLGVPTAPVLVTTPLMLQRARAAVRARAEPFHRSWVAVREDADEALGREPAPYHGPDYIKYFDVGRAGGWAARHLALAYHITGDVRYADRARRELAAWAADASPEVGSGTPHSVGLVLGRVLPIFGDAFAMIWHLLGTDERDAVTRWFGSMVKPVLTSRHIWRSGTVEGSGPPWLGRQYFNNHLTAQTLAIATIGFTVGDTEAISWAYDSGENKRDAKEVIAGAILMPDDIGSGGEGDLWYQDPTLREGAPDPEAGEIYDRQRMLDPEPHGLAYSLMHLQLLTMLAELADNNDYRSDLYGYVGPHGENLSVALDYYADFLVTGDTASRSGYYAGEAAVPVGRVAAYEVAYRHYPENENIKRVLETVDRVSRDVEFFGRSAVLTHGVYRGTE